VKVPPTNAELNLHSAANATAESNCSNNEELRAGRAICKVRVDAGTDEVEEDPRSCIRNSDASFDEGVVYHTLLKMMSLVLPAAECPPT